MGDFGTRLREARERKGISLRQIAAATKISVGALEGLERNDISKLPGGIFSRAFVRSYAIEVGLDPDETVRYFLQQFGGEGGPATPTAPAPPAPSRLAARAPARVVTPPPSDVTDEVDFESKQRMAGVVLKLVLVSLPIAATILYFTTRGPRAAQPPGAAGTAPAAAAQEPAHDEPAPAATPAAPVDKPVPPPAPAAQTGIAIEIAPSAECWTKLTVDGEVVLSRVIAAGERETRQFRDSAVLQVGDAATCAFAIDGRPAKSLGEAGQVREIRITRDNYKAFLR